jgi:hypothetical protein
MPSHNEPYLEKSILEQVMGAAEYIRAGKGDYVEDTDEGEKIQRYEFSQFSIITKER